MYEDLQRSKLGTWNPFHLNLVVHSRLQFNRFHRSIFKEKPVSCSLFSDRFSVGDSHPRQHKTSSRHLAHGEDNNYCYESLIRTQFSRSSKPCPSKHYNAIKGHSLQNFCWHKCADPDGALGTMRHGADLVIISTPFFADIVLERSTLGL